MSLSGGSAGFVDAGERGGGGTNSLACFRKSSLAKPTTCLLLLLLLAPLPVDASPRSCNPRHSTGKACERLNKFLQNVLKAREDLTWIDETVAEMQSDDIISGSPELQEKINVMFYRDARAADSPENKNDNEIHERRKRNPRRTASPRLKREKARRSPHEADTSTDKEDFNLPRPGYESASPREQNFNSAEREIRAKNAIPEADAGAADPLEKVLQSINVFPAEKSQDPYGSEAGTAPRAADDAAKTDFEPRIDKAERPAMSNLSLDRLRFRFGRSLQSLSFGNKKSSVKKDYPLSETENERDESEMKRALSGELAQEIVDSIFNHVKNKKQSNVARNLAIQPHTNPFDSMVVDDLYLQAMKDQQKAAITKKLRSVVEQIISDEVEKKACSVLPPDLNSFMQWLLEIENQDTQSNKIETEKSLDNSQMNSKSLTIYQWNKKAEILRKLLDEYEDLSKKDKHKVQAVYEYLENRLDFAEMYIDSLRSQKSSST